jgi:WD40 repeat protein
MAGEDKKQLLRPGRLPTWTWILIVPITSWLILFFVLVAVGFLPVGIFGFTNIVSSTPTPVPDPAVRVLRGHTGSVKGVAFSPDGTTLASVGDETAGRLKLWRVADGSLLYSVDAHEGGAYCVSFSPDGKLIATGGQDGLVRLWNAADGAPIRNLTGSVADLTSVAFSPDGHTIAASSWGMDWANAVDTVHLWRVDDGAPLLQLNGNPRVATSVSFSPDGMYLAAGGDDYRDSPGVYIWHLPDGKLVHTMNDVTSWAVKFVPEETTGNSKMTLAIAAGPISFISVPDGAVTHTIANGGGTLGQSLAFSPDGRLLASGSWDNTVRLWRMEDVLNGKQNELQTWRGHDTFVESVAFSPDGKLVASGSLDKTVRLWQVPPSMEK